MNIKNIYIIDDESDIAEIIKAFSSVHNIKTNAANSWDNVSINQLKEADLLLLDLHFPEIDGLDILEHLKKIELRIPIVFCSGQDENVIDTAADLLKAHGLNYAGKIQKPFSSTDFSTLLATLYGLDFSTRISTLDSPNATTHEELLDKSILQDAIRDNYFSVAFQPQFCSQRRRLSGVECLARLNIPGRKQIMPDTFIPKLLAYDLIDEFTLNILEYGLRVLNDLPLPSDTKIAFNLSTTSLTNTFIDLLCACCKTFRFSPSEIVWEITETATLEINQYTKTLMTKMRLVGFNLSLDDFGTGYSTIQEIDALPFNEIKIDKQFIQSMHDRKTSLAIVSATIQLGKALNFRVVAEGVETIEQANTLKKLECDILQGYFHSYPLNSTDFGSFVDQYNKNLKT